MGESTSCLMHPFSYHNGLLNEPNNNHGNHVRVLGESISFGRFTSVPQKHYVEEAKSFTQPGSVAQKKAFFEAHYKKIAAQKAAAAALLEQEKAAAAAQQVNDDATENSAITTELLESSDNLDDHVCVSVDSITSHSKRPLLKSKSSTTEEVTKPMLRRKPVASVNPQNDNISTLRTKNLNTNECNDKRRSTPKSWKALMNSHFVGQPKTESTKPPPSVRTTPKRGETPIKTPAKASVKGVNKQPLETSFSVNRRVETPVQPPVSGSKSSGSKWHILSAVSKSLSSYGNKMQSPTISSPFVLRTEDRAARRKQKLEEQFNEKGAQQAHHQTKLKEKAETEFRRLRQSFCFKARPLPNFYKERETPNNQMKKTPEANPKSFTPQRKAPSSAKKKSSRRLWNKNDQNPSHQPVSSVA